MPVQDDNSKLAFVFLVALIAGLIVAAIIGWII